MSTLSINEAYGIVDAIDINTLPFIDIVSMAQAQELAITTRVHSVSGKTPTLRTSIPLELAKSLNIGEKDTLIWVEATHEGKKGLFVRKVE